MDSFSCPSLDLMERAARSVSKECLDLAGGSGRTAVFVCGRGGNGGDGFAAARLYAQAGGRSLVTALYGTERLTPDARANYERAKAETGVAFVAPEDVLRVQRPAVWVDAVFGIGFDRALDGTCGEVFRRMEKDRQAGSRVLCVDIASGLNGLTGCADPNAVHATRTVTFECAKTGHYLLDGMDFTGELTVAPLGIPGELLPGDAFLHAGPDDALGALPPRKRNSHKGTYGHLLIVAGSRGMAGAAQMCAQAAMRSGAGLVTLAVPESLVPIVQTGVPCAMAIELPEADGAISRDAAPIIERALEGKSAVCVGPGLSLRAHPDAIKAILCSEIPAVVDADALNIIAAHDELKGLLTLRHILTPHPGEAARLLGGKMSNPIEAAEKLRALGANVVYKGAASIIMGERGRYIRTSGTSGMAKGGSGDVLTGMTGALLARGLAPETAAWAAAALHGFAGELAARRWGETAMTPWDMIDALGGVFSHDAD